MSISTIMSSNIITLTTDFGLKDPYVAEMKATILGIRPNSIIVDITHQITKFNIRMGAFVLASTVPYFADSAVHVAVVDPGVGTQRRPIVIQTHRSFFVGPDNGLLILAAEKQGILRVHELTNPRFMLPKVSNTFHGRDIFAPVAAHLLNGVKPEVFGPKIREPHKPEFVKVKRKNNTLIGEILHTDDFGNIITNISEKELSQSQVKNAVNIELSSCKLKLKLYKAYGEIEPRELLALIGSHGYLEIALNQGNATEKLKVKPGAKIKLLF